MADEKPGLQQTFLQMFLFFQLFVKSSKNNDRKKYNSNIKSLRVIFYSLSSFATYFGWISLSLPMKGAISSLAEHFSSSIQNSDNFQTNLKQLEAYFSRKQTIHPESKYYFFKMVFIQVLNGNS